MGRIVIIFLTLILTGPGPLRAGIITVAQDGSGDVTTVQEGIDMAASGDTVLVEQGTYYENLHIEVKPLTLASNYIFSNNPADRENTIIDGNHQGSVIVAKNINGFFSVEGLTIQNGKGVYPNGGGIYLENCENTYLLNSLVHENFAKNGGGIKINNSDVYFAGNTICYNHAYKYGGGIFAWNSGFVEFSSENRCSIYMNYAAAGCDIHKKESVEFSTLFADTLIVNNPSEYYIISTDSYGNGLDDIEINYQNHKLEKIDADVYVSPQGDNANSGLSPDSPFRNIWYAMLRVQNDSINPNTVYLDSGTYAPSTNEEMFPVHPKQNIRIIGNSTQNTLLDAEQTAGMIWAGVGTENKFLHLEDLELTNGVRDDGGITIKGLDSAFIKNLYIHDLQGLISGGLRIANTDTSYIENIEISGVTGMKAMQVNNNEENTQCVSKISNFKIQNNGPSEQETGGGGIKMIGKGPAINSMDVTMVNGLITENTNNITLWNNIGSALSIYAYVSLKLVNATLADNLANDGGALAIKTTYGPANVQVYNSIFYDNGPEQISVDGESSTLKLYHCDVENGMEGIDIVGDHTVTMDEGCIDIDPIFTTYENTDYFLQSNSSCINTGTMDINDFDWPATDLLGNPRFHGNVDMGPYENHLVPTGRNMFE
ncbi:MAG: hypothetical protein K9I47_09225, partial [Bacteroidales bacterium]|nr:hypothetical protein [Bacteroidales bacterium]